MLDVSLLPKQWKVFQTTPGVDYDIKLYQGGVGSTCGGAVLRDCVTGKTHTMKELWEHRKSITVQAIGYNGEPVKAIALPPIREGIGSLYRVEMESGLHINVTAAHRFLKVDTWAELHDLKPGEQVVVGESVLCGPCATEYVQLVTEHAGFQADCLTDQNRYDALPHQAPKNDQAFFPQQLYVHTCSDQFFSSPTAHPHKSNFSGPLGSLFLNPHAAAKRLFSCIDEWLSEPLSLKYPLFSLFQWWNNLSALTRKWCIPSAPSADEILSHAKSHSVSKLSRHKPEKVLALWQSLFEISESSQVQEPFSQVQEPAHESYASLNSPYRLDTIKSITYIGEDYYFDLHVPGYNNYLAQGFVNHNSGKTFLGTIKGLDTLYNNQGATWLVGSDTMSRLSITTCETYEEVLDAAKIRYKHNQSKHIIKIRDWDDSRIIFKGIADPKSLRSVNGIGGHIEEASLITEGSYLEFMGRLRQAGPGQPIQLILTTNPQATKGYLFEHFQTNSGITLQEVRGKQIKISRQRIIAATLDNPHVSDAFIAGLASSYDEELYKIMVLGLDGNYTAGLVCKGWSSLANVRDIPYDPTRRIYLTCDFNVDPMCWALAHIGIVNSQRHYEFFDEICIENTNIINTVKEFAKRYGNHLAGIVITGDCSGNSRTDGTPDPNQTRYDLLLKTLSDYGVSHFALDAPRANPLIDSRIEVWNAFVCNQNGERRVAVDPRCKQIIRNMENLHFIPGSSVIWQPTPKQIESDNKQKFERQDMFDAVSYLVNRYDPKIQHGQVKKTAVIASQFRPRR